MRKTIAMLVTLPVLISGCAVMSSDEGCQKVGGIKKCASLDEVYQMSNNGTITAQGSPTMNAASPQQQSNRARPGPRPGLSQASRHQGSGYDVLTPDIGQPVRYQDSIQKVWIFPYEDSAGNYHESSIVYTVIDSAHWVGHPTRAIKDDEYQLSKGG